MSDQIKNNDLFKELLRYKSNKMTDQEQYQFERGLERDPFLAEALDGFEAFKSIEIEKDLATLDIIKGKKRFRWQISRTFVYSVAAGVSILLIVFVFFRFRENLQMTKHKNQPEKEAVPLIDSTLFAQAADSLETEAVDSGVIMLAKNSEIVTKNPQISMQSESQASKQSSTVMPVKRDTQRTSKQPALVPTVVMSTMKADEDKAVENALNLTLQQEPAQGTSIDEKPLADSHSSSSENTRIGAASPGYRKGVNAQAQPLGGFDLFKQYLDKEMVYPASEGRTTRQTVKVRFTVTTSGQLKNFSIDKSAGNPDFDKEAIRLLQNGPKWAPAVKDGIPVETETEFRMVIKPQ